MIKTDFDQKDFDILMQVQKPVAKLNTAYKRQIPISASEHADLMSMIKSGLIPDDYANFYTNFLYPEELMLTLHRKIVTITEQEPVQLLVFCLAFFCYFIQLDNLIYS